MKKLLTFTEYAKKRKKKKKEKNVEEEEQFHASSTQMHNMPGAATWSPNIMS